MSAAATPAGDGPLLAAEGLVRHFRRRRPHLFRPPEVVRAVDGIDLVLDRGETLGLVGESGCGKSTVGRLVLGLDRPTAGRVRFAGSDVAAWSGREWRDRRRDAQLVFQDPVGALDPRMTVARQIVEPLRIHDIGSAAARAGRLEELMQAVGLSPDVADRYPHEISGGQQQRVVIARALALRPTMLVCDEPVSALDVSVQAQVVNLLAALQRRFGLAYLFISHDLKIVRHLSHRVTVMYLGVIVESGGRDEIFDSPLHPYTRALISAIPVPDPEVRPRRTLLAGDPPSPIDPPSGCRFHTRCPLAEPVCAARTPALKAVGPSRKVACHLADGTIAAKDRRN